MNITILALTVTAAMLATAGLFYLLGKRDGERDERARCIRLATVAGRWEAGVPGATCDSVWRAVVEELNRNA